MKTLWKIVGGILVFLALVLLVARVTGLEPPIPPNDHPSKWGKRPGLWLKGDLVTTPVTDWSFTDKYQRIKIQTRTWYLLPHSITVTCTCYQGKLYLVSDYPPGAGPYPSYRSWDRYVVRDPHILVKIGDKLYPAKVAYLVTDPAEHAAVVQAKINKYPPYGHTINVMQPPEPGAYEAVLRVISDPPYMSMTSLPQLPD